MATYIGFYGMGLIIYFTCQFMNDTKDNHENEIPRGFFSTFHHINERQFIYSMIERIDDENETYLKYLDQLINKEWVKNVYQIYYSDQSLPANIIDERVNDCSRKYHAKIQNLRSKHAYYISDTTTPLPLLTTIAYLDE